MKEEEGGNGVLAQVPGEYVSAAARTLPDAETAAQDNMETTIDVPGLGAVRFTFERFHHRRGKASRLFWTAKRAVQVRSEF